MNSEAMIPPEIKELTPEGFSQWKRHPVTVAYRHWLLELKGLLAEQHLQRWLAGPVQPEYEAEARARLLMCDQLLDLNVLHIMRTYFSDDELEVDGRLKPKEDINEQ